jgi:hypothetical protein
VTGPTSAPTAGAHPADAVPPAGADTFGAPPAPRLWAQTHALRTLADFLDRHGCDGLALTLNDDRIGVQVPAALGPTGTRLAALARLAAALGTRTTPYPAHPAPGGWIETDGHLAGHRIHAFTPLEHEEPTP